METAPALEKEMAQKIEEKKPRLYNSVDEWIFSETKGVVQSGPFVGMTLLWDQAWKDGNLSTKCLGCYEEELHPFLKYEIRRLQGIRRPKIVDVGCAEGYYAIGLARRVPDAIVYGVDISKECLAVAESAAARNGVTIRTAPTMEEAFAEPDFVIVDVEGDEDQYLDLSRFPALERADIVVECHDYDTMSYTRILTERFSETHDVNCIFEGARNPNKYPILVRQQSLHRWMAVCEGRPCMMNWLTMKARP